MCCIHAVLMDAYQKIRTKKEHSPEAEDDIIFPDL